MNRGHQRNIRPDLAALDGARIPGGCDDCAAHQSVDATQAPLFVLTVQHDDTCPAWREMQR